MLLQRNEVKPHRVKPHTAKLCKVGSNLIWPKEPVKIVKQIIMRSTR